MNSYAEISPSGEGLHIFVEGKLSGKGINLGNIEMYDNKRYFTVTGQALPEYPSIVEERDAELKALYREAKAKEAAKKLESKGKKEANKPEAKPKKSQDAPQPAGENLGPKDARLIARGKALYGEKFVKLWEGDYSGYTEDDSQNEADLALCNYLSYLTEGDAGEVDRRVPTVGTHAGQMGRGPLL